ncbi:hypothetical protein F4811DRAFT_345838 [Daldinia bambusicola]|nr:hypothetical protein F4811DRAFT_345838 [Daldinia bambusicola]
MASSDDGAADNGWPAKRVPIELFTMVAGKLDRNDVKALRLVCKEFSEKLDDYFFKRVVINVNVKLEDMFKILGQGYDHSVHADITEYLAGSDSLHNMSSHVQRLALALELSEQELATPEDDGQEVLEIRDWGICRWPADDKLCSNTRLAKMARSMESGRGVSYILANVKDIQELAISCDGGLGYLQGPDVNPFQPPGLLPIFSSPTKVPNVVRPEGDWFLPSLQVTFKKPYKLELIEKKLAALGIPPDQIAAEIKGLISFERTDMDGFTYEERSRPSLPTSRYGDRQIVRPLRRLYNYRLQPDQLTDTQARLLFQYITAQQALVQAFTLAVADNASSYSKLTKINIARLPSLHIDLLCRDDFWSRIPKLEEVSLGVVPDWRELIQEHKYHIETRQVYPTMALPKVFKLLNNYIGKQTRIKKLHFEWLCGGEFAPGWLQREKYILPAPFLKKHRLVICSGDENILILRHIKHLSLKNCWFAPNVFYQIIRTMSQDWSLETLELESVSLTGPPIFRESMLDQDDPDQKPWPAHLSPTTTSEDLSLLQEPLPLSWSHIIDMLTPGETIRERVDAQQSPSDPPLLIRKDLQLRKIVFKSCGYVIIPDRRFVSNRRFVNLNYPPSLKPIANKMTRDFVHKWQQLSGCMQVSTDRHLGHVSPLLDPREEYAMRNVFGLHAGWAGTYAWHLFQASEEDGIAGAGVGRFSGTIEVDAYTIWRRLKAIEEEEDEEFALTCSYKDEGRPQPYEYDIEEFEVDYEADDRDGLDDLLKAAELRLSYDLTFEGNFDPPENDEN